VYNQLVENGNFDNASGWSSENINRTFSDNKLTGTCNGDNKQYLSCYRHIPAIKGHKYLGIITMKTSIATTSAKMAILNSSYVQLGAAEENIDVSSKKTVGLILNCSGTDTNGYVFYYAYGSFNTGDTIEFENAQFFDLTRNGIDFVTTVEEAKAELLKRGVDVDEYNEFNAGEIKSTIISKIEAYSTEGVKLGEINIPNAPLRLDGVNDIHNTLTFEEQEDGTYNAILTRKFGIVDLGTINWGTPTSTGWTMTIGAIDAKPNESASTMPNAICDKYTVGTPNKAYATDGYVSINTSSNVTARDSSFIGKTKDEIKDMMSGVHLLCELATPTTDVIATGLTFDDTTLKIEKGGTIKAIYEGVPPIASIDFMTKGE